jgi:proteasome lid subunit RPN8/RPN11
METKIISYSRISDVAQCLKLSSDNHSAVEICILIGYSEEEKLYYLSYENNIASDPRNFFCISPARYLKFKQSYKIIAIFHSHVCGDEKASPFDIKMAENCCVPFMIFSLNSRKFNFYEPQNKEYDVNLVSRFKEKFL